MAIRGLMGVLDTAGILVTTPPKVLNPAPTAIIGAVIAFTAGDLVEPTLAARAPAFPTKPPLDFATQSAVALATPSVAPLAALAPVMPIFWAIIKGAIKRIVITINCKMT